MLLEKMEENLQKLKEKERECIEKSFKAINNKAQLDAKKASEEEILEVIANLEEQWKTMTIFFDRINKVICNTLAETMIKFKELAATQLGNNPPISSMAYQLLTGPAEDSTDIAYCLEQVHRCTRVENPALKFLPKSLGGGGGGKDFGQKWLGCTPISGFIAFLLTSVLKFA
jgi:hypothetical protein